MNLGSVLSARVMMLGGTLPKGTYYLFQFRYSHSGSLREIFLDVTAKLFLLMVSFLPTRPSQGGLEIAPASVNLVLETKV